YAACKRFFNYGTVKLPSCENIKLSERIAPVPVLRGFGTFRVSTSFAAARRTRMPPVPLRFRPPNVFEKKQKNPCIPKNFPV
ncbi:MAG: hypothetical protein ACLR6S_17685, partial [Lacrimispora saccharolytica]